MRKINVEILQTNGTAAFRGLDEVGRRNVKLSEYHSVYRGVVYTDDENYMLWLPEQLFAEFNNELPRGWNGRSLSVSDILFVEENGGHLYMYCDHDGWQFIM